MTRKCHYHTLQTNPRHHKDETFITNNHKGARRHSNVPANVMHCHSMSYAPNIAVIYNTDAYQRHTSRQVNYAERG